MPTPIDLKPDTRLNLDFDPRRIATKAPLLLAGAGAAIASWSWAEQHYENIRAVLELTDDDLSLSTFKNYRLSYRQREKLVAAAKKRLATTALPLFLTALECATRPATQRNQIAHGLIGFWDTKPDVLVIYDPSSFQSYFRRNAAPTMYTGRMMTTGAEFEHALKELASSGMLFDSKDFERLTDQSFVSNEILIHLANMCSSDTKIAGNGEELIRSNPHVQAYLKEQIAAREAES